MLTQLETERLAHAYIEKFVSECHCADLAQVSLVLQKLQACAAFSYLAVKGRDNTVEMLEYLKRYMENEALAPKLEVVERWQLNG